MEIYIQLIAYPKTDKHLAWKSAVNTSCDVQDSQRPSDYQKNPWELWYGIRLIITPEKPNKSIVRPMVKLFGFDKKLLIFYLRNNSKKITYPTNIRRHVASPARLLW
jgi:hypothetical protein